MRKIFFICLLLCSMIVKAQTNQNVVVLKNGSQIRGTIMEQVPGESVKIQTSDGSIFVYNMNEVEKISLVEDKRSSSKDVAPLWSQNGHTGLDYSIYMGPVVIFGNGGSSVLFHGSMEVGKKFNRSFYLGAGAGIEAGGSAAAFVAFGGPTIYFPIDDSRIAPSLSIRGGIAYANDQTNGLVMVTPGFQLPLSSKLDLNVGVGYYGNFNDDSFHGVITRAGFTFHQPTRTTPRVRPVVETRNSGLQYEISSVGTLHRYADEREFRPDFQFVLSYKWNPNISVGIGYGHGSRYYGMVKDSYDEYYCGAEVGSSFFLRGRYRLNDNKFSPVAVADFGTAFTSKELTYSISSIAHLKGKKSYLFFNPAVGGSWRVAPNTTLDVLLGYQMATKGAKKEDVSEQQCKPVSDNGLTLNLSIVHTLKFLQSDNPLKDIKQYFGKFKK